MHKNTHRSSKFGFYSLDDLIISYQHPFFSLPPPPASFSSHLLFLLSTDSVYILVLFLYFAFINIKRHENSSAQFFSYQTNLFTLIGYPRVSL